MPDDIGNALQGHQSNLQHYLHEELYKRMGPVVDPTKLLPIVDEAYCCAPAEPFRNHRYDYARGMMMVYLSSTVNSEGTTYVTAVYTVNYMMLLKDGYCMLMLDAHYWYRSVKWLRNQENLEWAAEPLRIHYAFPDNGKLIFLAQVIELRMIANISTANVQREVKFADMMQDLLSYAQPFEEKDSVFFVDVRLMNGVETWCPKSSSLPAIERPTYAMLELVR